MLKFFLLTSLIAAIAFAIVNIVFALTSRGFDIPDWLGVSLYIIVFYLAPIAFAVGFIGSMVWFIKSKIGKRGQR